MIICQGLIAQTGSISFTYDSDGNMEHRLVISVPSYVKTNFTQKDTIAVEDKLDNQNIILYPNPTRGLFKISVNKLDEAVKNYFYLFSSNGSRLMNKNLSNNMTTVDISNYPKGTYLLNISLGGKVSKWKVIKQ